MILHSLATCPSSKHCILNPADLLTPPVRSSNSFKLWQNNEVHWACSPLYFSSLCSLTTLQANTWGTGTCSYSVGIAGQRQKVLCTLSCLCLSAGNNFNLLHKEMGNVICNKSCKNSSFLTEIIGNWAHAKPDREHSGKTHTLL